jgi:hypothetical protein
MAGAERAGTGLGEVPVEFAPMARASPLTAVRPSTAIAPLVLIFVLRPPSEGRRRIPGSPIVFVDMFASFLLMFLVASLQLTVAVIAGRFGGGRIAR